MDILSTPELWAPPLDVKADQLAQMELDVLRGAAAPPSLEENHLASKPRAALVDELMIDPLYTNRRLLSHLSRQKLARMVLQSRERLAAIPMESARGVA
jgi:hypothetical protein